MRRVSRVGRAHQFVGFVQHITNATARAHAVVEHVDEAHEERVAYALFVRALTLSCAQFTYSAQDKA